jgi:hypothetical protein
MYDPVVTLSGLDTRYRVSMIVQTARVQLQRLYRSSLLVMNDPVVARACQVQGNVSAGKSRMGVGVDLHSAQESLDQIWIDSLHAPI